MEDEDGVRRDGLKLLQKCKVSELSQLLHMLIDKHCGRKAPIYSQFQHIWNVTEWWTVTDICKCLLLEAVRVGWTKAELTNKVECLPVEHQQAFHDVLFSRREEILQRLAQETCSTSYAHLMDFDWQLKLVIGSDKMANTNIPLAQVTFDICEAQNRRNVLLEMDKQQLSKFISALESANKTLCQLQT